MKQEDATMQEKLVADLRRSFETYNTVSSNILGRLVELQFQLKIINFFYCGVITAHS